MTVDAESTGTRNGPELLFELAGLVEHTLGNEGTLTPQTAREIAYEACVAICTLHGGGRAWMPLRRRDVQGLSFFALSRHERRMACAVRRASAETVALRYRVPLSVVRLTCARTAIETRAARLNASQGTGRAT